jgi:DedD protein
MCNKFLLGVLLALAAPASFAKTPLDLMLEGRFRDAKAILDTSNVSPRYQLLYFAMIESDAVRACSLYQVVALRYPNSDCDSVARARLDQAQEAGFPVVPIAEWAQAAPSARPLALQHGLPPHGVSETPSPEAAPPPPATVAVTELTPSVPAPPPVQPEAGKEEPRVSMRDTLIATVRAPEFIPRPETGTISVPSPSAPPVSVPVEEPSEPVVKDTVLPSPPAVEPMASVPAPAADVSLKPAARKIEKVPPSESASETLETVQEREPAPASRGPWYIQVGAFANSANAQRLAHRLENAGYPVKLVPRDSSKGTLLQVRVGGYAARAELPAVAEKLKEEFGVPTAFVLE